MFSIWMVELREHSKMARSILSLKAEQEDLVQEVTRNLADSGKELA